MRILIFIFLFLSTAVQASFDMNERMKNAYNHIIGLEFHEAHKLLNKEKNEHPNNGIIILYENYIDFLTIIIGEDEDYFNTNYIIQNKIVLYDKTLILLKDFVKTISLARLAALYLIQHFMFHVCNLILGNPKRCQKYDYS